MGQAADALGALSALERLAAGHDAQDRAANGVNEITSITINAGSPVSLTRDALGNPTQDPTAYNHHDAAGSPSGRKYTYDAENGLTKVQRLSNSAVLEAYVYDALGGRIETKTPPQTPAGGGGSAFHPLIPDDADPNEICATGVLTVRTRHVLAGLEAVEEHGRGPRDGGPRSACHGGGRTANPAKPAHRVGGLPIGSEGRPAGRTGFITWRPPSPTAFHRERWSANHPALDTPPEKAFARGQDVRALALRLNP